MRIRKFKKQFYKKQLRMMKRTKINRRKNKLKVFE